MDEELKTTIDKLNADNEKKRKEFEDKVKELQLDLFEYMSYVGEL